MEAVAGVQCALRYNFFLFGILAGAALLMHVLTQMRLRLKPSAGLPIRAFLSGSAVVLGAAACAFVLLTIFDHKREQIIFTHFTDYTKWPDNFRVCICG